MSNVTQKCSNIYYPVTDKNGRCIEDESDYISRLRGSLLPNIPPSVLSQWFYRHYESMCRYWWLDYQTLRFVSEPEEWQTEDIPIGNCGAYERVIKGFAEVVENPKHRFKYDWLARYMFDNGTWPEPIILFDNYDGLIRAEYSTAGIPYHLLEGHRRLAIFSVLKKKAALENRHKVWIARKER